MKVRLVGNQTGRYYYEPDSIVAPISLDPFSGTAKDVYGFTLRIDTLLQHYIAIQCSYNELIILRNALNTVLK